MTEPDLLEEACLEGHPINCCWFHRAESSLESDIAWGMVLPGGMSGSALSLERKEAVEGSIS